MKYIFYILIILGLSACKQKAESNAIQEETTDENILTLSVEQNKNIKLNTVQLQEQTMSSTLKLNGTVEVSPQQILSISSAIGGFVKSSKLQNGMQFQKGELLATLEDNQYIQIQQDYLTAQVELKNAEATFIRQRELNANKASSDKDFLQAQTEYQRLQIQVKSLTEKLRLIHIDPNSLTVGNIRSSIPIYAPFSGFVSKVNVHIGQYVGPSDVLFELINPQDLLVNLKVYEQDWEHIQIGQTLRVFTNSNPNQSNVANVKLRSKQITEDRSISIYANFKQLPKNLIPGQYVQAETEVPAKIAMALPETCVLNFEGKSYVFIDLGNLRYQMQAVETGIKAGSWTEIKNPTVLKDKKIVDNGAYTLLMALKNKAED